MNDVESTCQSKLSSVLNALTQSVVIINTQGIVMHFNNNARSQMNRFSKQALQVGLPAIDSLPSQNKSFLLDKISGVLTGNQVSFELNMALAGQNKTEWFELSFSPIYEGDLLIGATLMWWSIEHRKQTEIKMLRKLDFEQLIALISSRFISISDVSQAIMLSLKDIGVFSHSSRAYVFEFNSDNTLMDNTFEWCLEGIEPEIDKLQGIPIETFPWWISKLKKGEVIEINDVSQLTVEAAAEKEILEMQSIKSILVLPIMIHQELRGFVGFDNVVSTGSWDTDDLTLLKVTSEIISHAFERFKAESELINYNNELEAALKQLKIAESQIIQQEQLVGIGQLAAGVAHEINNPLGYILSNMDMLKQNIGEIAELYKAYDALNKCKDDHNKFYASMHEIETLKQKYALDEIVDDLEELLEDMEEGLRRVSKIVNGLRFFSRVDQTEEYCLYDLNEGIENTLIVANNELKQMVIIDKKLENIPLITCVGNQINQVLLNVVLNSTYAIKNNIRNEEGKLSIETKSDSEHVYCKISDNGGGISEEIEKNIFTPFFTTKPVGAGAGLGLSIAYDIVVNKHKGKIDVINNFGIGTTFNITLPINH